MGKPNTGADRSWIDRLQFRGERSELGEDSYKAFFLWVEMETGFM